MASPAVTGICSFLSCVPVNVNCLTDNDVWYSDVEGQYLEPIYLIYVVSEVILTTMMSRISYDILFVLLCMGRGPCYLLFAENPASHVAVVLLW
jgi:hypothetical protein